MNTSDTILYRVTSDEELQEVDQLADQIWHEHFTPIIGDDQVAYMLQKFQCFQAMKEQILNQHYEYYFLCYEGNHVGYTAICREPEHLFLSKLYLLKEYRGRKLSRTALQALIALCRQDGLKSIYLTVNRHNDNTIAAYYALGFQTIREQKTDIGNGFVMDDYVMELPIA